VLSFTVEWIESDKLKPAPYNPRKDLQPEDLEYIKIWKSINEFGLVDPLVVNKDHTIISGHQRFKVLQDAGFDKVPCSMVDLDKTKEKALNIALNKITGGWDFPKLTDLLIELDAGDLDMEAVGYSTDELAELLGYVSEDYSDLDNLNESLDGAEDASISIIVPKMHAETVAAWLANGESETGPGMGKGVLKRCELL
jgi:ParB-like chromosome segregation protein Spo0J